MKPDLFRNLSLPNPKLLETGFVAPRIILSAVGDRFVRSADFSPQPKSGLKSALRTYFIVDQTVQNAVIVTVTTS